MRVLGLIARLPSPIKLPLSSDTRTARSTLIAPPGRWPPGLSRRSLLGAGLLPMLAPRDGSAAAVLAATPISRMDLKWWRERHQAKLQELRRVRPNLIFLGDSITQNWEYDGPGEGRSFVPVWRRFYGDRNAVNLGFTGDTTASLLWRIRNGETDGIAPKVAVILIGANNLGRLRWSAEDTLFGIDTIIADLRRRLPSTRVLLLGVLPSERSDWTTQTAWSINRALDTKYAADKVVVFLDVGHVLMRGNQVNRELYYDPKLNPPGPPLHPSAQGMAAMAVAMEPVLAGLLGDKPHQ